MKPPSLQGLGGEGLAPTPHALQKALLRALSSLFVPFPIQAHCSAFSSFFFFFPSPVAAAAMYAHIHAHAGFYMACARVDREVPTRGCLCSSTWFPHHVQALERLPRAGKPPALPLTCSAPVWVLRHALPTPCQDELSSQRTQSKRENSSQRNMQFAP